MNEPAKELTEPMRLQHRNQHNERLSGGLVTFIVAFGMNCVACGGQTGQSAPEPQSRGGAGAVDSDPSSSQGGLPNSAASGGGGQAGSTNAGSDCDAPLNSMIGALELEPTDLQDWRVWHDDSDTAELSGTVADAGLVPSSGGAPNSEHALHLEGRGFQIWGANAVLHRCIDASGYRGLRFWMKGQAENARFVLSIQTTDLTSPEQGGHCEIDCDNAYAPSTQPLLTDSWQAHQVLFEDLRLDNRTPAVTQYPFNSELVFVKFVIQKPSASDDLASFDFWLDAVELF